MTTIAPLPAAAVSTWDAVWTSGADLGDQRLSRELTGRRWRFLQDQIRRHLPGRQPLRCVELGAGEGDFSVLLARAGHEVTLVDFSARAIDRAATRFARLGLNAHFVQADLLDFARERAGEFDVSLSLGLIEHFAGEAQAAIVGAHAQVLRRDGMCFVSAPHAWCWPYRAWKSWLHLRGAWPYGYEKPLTAAGARRLASSAGLRTVAVARTGFAAAVDGCLLLPCLGHRRGWGDGCGLLNRLWGWDLNLAGIRRDDGCR